MQVLRIDNGARENGSRELKAVSHRTFGVRINPAFRGRLEFLAIPEDAGQAESRASRKSRASRREHLANLANNLIKFGNFSGKF